MTQTIHMEQNTPFAESLPTPELEAALTSQVKIDCTL